MRFFQSHHPQVYPRGSHTRTSHTATIPMSNRSTAKRSPSILVTDVRSNAVKGARAPFAGHHNRKEQPSSNNTALRKRIAQRANRYTDISVDKLLSNSSDIPSGQSRLPPHRGSPVLQPQLGRSLSPEPLRKNIRSIPKLSQSLPPRTSKTSQKLVLIPDLDRSPLPPMQQSGITPDLQAQIQRLRAELMPKEARAHEFPRMTAYFICEEFNLPAVLRFVRRHHEVKPRFYDEALYVPYLLPLLPGTDGFRVKSNNSAKNLSSKRFMEKMINRSEQTNHLYEYYSGVETPEDANNYSMDPGDENFEGHLPFDPSEPQFFPPDAHEEEGLSSQEEDTKKQDKVDPTLELNKTHAEMFVFAYGIVVFWNFSETHEKNILADLAFASDKPEALVINPMDDIETEEFHFEYDSRIHRPRIFNDMITLRSGDHLIKLTMSHAIAQSTKLCLFESRMVNNLQLISKLPKKLALTGRLGLKRQQLLKKSGKLFKLRVDVNLLSSILDTPDFFWDLEPALHPLYNAFREYLEIDQRVQVLNDRCKVFLEFSDIVTDSMNERNTNRITWMILAIIFISLSVSVFEFVIQLI